MLEISHNTIRKTCEYVQAYFPSTYVIVHFKDVVDDNELELFPNTKAVEQSEKKSVRIPDLVLEEMILFFQDKLESFMVFLQTIAREGVKHKIIEKYLIDEFIERISGLLIMDSKITIENYQLLEWVPTCAKREIFISISVPEVIRDYFGEALDCMHHRLHRSSIMFCTFALEAALRFQYRRINGTTKILHRTKQGERKREISFYELTKWAFDKKLIEVLYAEQVNLEFIRNYRNDLAHCDIVSKKCPQRLSREYASKMNEVIIHLVKGYINQLFYEIEIQIQA